MKKTALLLLCTLAHTVLWAQIGIYKIDGDLEVTGDTNVDGKVGIGTDTPEEELHIKSVGNPTLFLESTSQDLYSGGRIVLKSNSSNPDYGMFYIHSAITTADASSSILAIQKRGMDGAYKGNILQYSNHTDRWAISPGGIETLVITTNAVSALKELHALEGLDVTGDIKIDGNVGIGTDTPEQKMHLMGGLNPAFMIEATTQQLYNGPSLWLKTNSSDPETGVTVLAHTLVDAAYDKSQFVIQKRAMNGDFKADILVYRHDLDRWAIRPGGTEAFVLSPSGVKSELIFRANDGMEVTNGLTSDSITLGGVTHTAWPASFAPIPDADSNYDLFSSVSFDQTSDHVIVLGTGGSVENTTTAAVFGVGNDVVDSNNVNIFGESNQVGNSDFAFVMGHGNESNSAQLATVWGGDNLIVSSEYTTVWGLNNSSYSYLSTVFGRFATYDATHDGTTWVATEPLLLVGNGTDNTNRSNALELMKNGNFKVSGTIQAPKGVVFGNATDPTAGSIRWTGTDFEGHNGTDWKPLSESNTVNGDISMGDFQ